MDIAQWQACFISHFLCSDLADRGALHKAVILTKEVHVIEETQLFRDSEPVLTLLLSSKKVMWVWLVGWLVLGVGVRSRRLSPL